MIWTNESHWRICSECRCLWYGETEGGICSTGGPHRAIDDAHYGLLKVSKPYTRGISGWCRCDQCQMLWRPGSASRCPAGGMHREGREEYAVDGTFRTTGTAARHCVSCGAVVLSGSVAACINGDAHRLDATFILALKKIVGTIRIHTRVLVSPDVDVRDSIANMHDLFSCAAGVAVNWVSNEALEFPFDTIKVGNAQNNCKTVTADQIALHATRASLSEPDIVVFYVRATDPTTSGCATHPATQPGAVVVCNASQWTTAHEVGHVLFLDHVADSDRLMREGSADHTNPPPDLDATEVKTILDSGFVLFV